MTTALGPNNFHIELPISDGKPVVDAAEFGVHPENPSNGAAFARAIEHCRSIGTAKLVLPKGVYRFDDGEHLSFRGLKDFVFDGQRSELVFSIPRSFVSITGCERVLFRDFIIDWDWQKQPLARIAQITQVAPGFESFDVLFPEHDEIPDDLRFRDMIPMHQRTLTPGCPRGFEFHETVVEDHREKVTPNTLRLFCRRPEHMTFLSEGQTYRMRHFVYDANGISMDSNQHLTLEDITIYSAPGHALISSGDQHHWQLLHCSLKRRPGKTRCISATADGHHISNSQGFYRMEHCDFSYNGDDCLNIHDNSCTGIKKVGERTAVVGNVRRWRNPFEPGDPVEFRNGDLSPMNLRLSVDSVKWNEEQGECEIAFDELLPDDLAADTILFNRRYDSGNYIVRNNFFHHNRARGMLIHASNGLVEGNHFYMNQGSAIQIQCGVEQRWAEGFGVQNLVVRNNLIESCDVNHWNMAVVYMDVYLPGGHTRYPIFRDIVFESNTIVDCPQAAFFLSSCANVTVTGNTVMNPNNRRICAGDGNTLQTRERYKGTIGISHAQDVHIAGNTRLETIETLDKSIHVDTETCKRVMVTCNKGFQEEATS